jgi:hypothetical protein
MNIYVEGKLAAIKSGSSFEYVSENRLFTGSDGYTMSIDFPIKDCQQNLDIFGFINRRDVPLNTLRYNCDICERHIRLSGTLTITKITESVVTGQFLEGRSAQNFDDTFDDIYINELDLGEPVSLSTDVTPETAWRLGGNENLEPVALPWVNDSNDGATNNFATYSEKKGCFVWDEDTTDAGGLSYFMYLLPLVKKICDAVWYSYDFSVWDNSKWRYLLCCNALPFAWGIPQYARALPHWSLTELFERIEYLLNCEFDIDHKARSIVMSFTTDVVESLKITRLGHILDSYTSDVSADEHSAEYVGAKNLKYKEPGYDAWSYMSCDWFVDDIAALGLEVQRFDTFAELWAEAKKKQTYVAPYKSVFANNGVNTIYYAADLDLYFIHKIDNKKGVWSSNMPDMPSNGEHLYAVYTTHLIAINMFGGRIVDTSDDADELEIEIIPVRIDETDDEHGNAMFLSPSSYDETYDNDDDTDSISDYDNMPFSQSHVYQTIGFGDLDEVEYYSTMNVGFWDGTQSFAKKIPAPHIGKLEIYPNWEYALSDWSLQLNDKTSNAYQSFTPINPKAKYSVAFLADEMPNVRGLFNICGKLYVCAKITATFSETGMSKLLKGEFYPVAE